MNLSNLIERFQRTLSGLEALSLHDVFYAGDQESSNWALWPVSRHYCCRSEIIKVQAELSVAIYLPHVTYLLLII